MAVIFWWCIPVVVALMVGLILWHTRDFKRRNGAAASRALAHTSRYVTHPMYHLYLSRYHRAVRVMLSVFGVACVAVILIVSRFASVSVVQPELHNRDIMLCLDVSGSMIKTDAAILKVFSELVDGFKGERIGMTVFDSSPASVFPLTDDYPFVKDQLKTLSNAMGGTDFQASYESGVFEGTSEGEGSSLIGDGLAACTLHFDNMDTKRSRSIILATDNEVSGPSIVTLPQAGVVAKDKGIRVYGINPNDYSSAYYSAPEAQEYKKVVLSTGGAYYSIDSPTKVSQIIEEVKKQDATRFKGAPQRVLVDQPVVWIGIGSVALVVYYVFAWRLKL